MKEITSLCTMYTKLSQGWIISFAACVVFLMSSMHNPNQNRLSFKDMPRFNIAINHVLIEIAAFLLTERKALRKRNHLVFNINLTRKIASCFCCPPSTGECVNGRRQWALPGLMCTRVRFYLKLEKGGGNFHLLRPLFVCTWGNISYLSRPEIIR